MPTDVPANFSIVTLGVTDLARSARFYADLGWEQRGDLADGIVWFKTSGSWVGLFGHDALAEDTRLDAVPVGDLPAFRGVTLALNLASESAVDLAFARVLEVGGRIVKPAERLPWGGYSGYFTDPDGHLWEIAFAPMFPPDEHGRIEIGAPAD
jgi:predicted lactoylglutathione lyase